MNRIEMREMMSALADGQLKGEAFQLGLDAAAGEREARDAWETYHLIGDVLRSSDLAQGVSSAVFMEQLRQKLESEAVASPALSVPLRAASDPVSPQEGVSLPAANDGSFRWKLIAGFASIAAVAAVGWNSVGSLGLQSSGAQLAAAPGQPAVVASGDRPVMIRDARLDELLAAHRRFGGDSAIQMPAGALRQATFDGQAR